jgi:FKBP-type peptidyl-prolyl cis-trans isomerase SlpA
MPGQAFGERDEAAIETLSRDRFPANIQLERGQILAFSGAEGQDIPGAILEVNADTVQVDFNHPLAGREIEFEVQILKVENPPPE